jgi:hypothetical protein
MNLDTDIQVAIIGVLAGIAGGLVVGLVQYVLHHVGSRLRWREHLRESVADFLASSHDADVYFLTGQVVPPATLHALHKSLVDLKFIAPQPVVLAAHRVIADTTSMTKTYSSIEDAQKASWATAYMHHSGSIKAELIMEVRKAINADKRRA